MTKHLTIHYHEGSLKEEQERLFSDYRGNKINISGKVYSFDEFIKIMVGLRKIAIKVDAGQIIINNEPKRKITSEKKQLIKYWAPEIQKWITIIRTIDLHFFKIYVIKLTLFQQNSGWKITKKLPEDFKEPK